MRLCGEEKVSEQCFLLFNCSGGFVVKEFSVTDVEMLVCWKYPSQMFSCSNKPEEENTEAGGGGARGARGGVNSYSDQ